MLPFGGRALVSLATQAAVLESPRCRAASMPAPNESVAPMVWLSLGLPLGMMVKKPVIFAAGTSMSMTWIWIARRSASGIAPRLVGWRWTVPRRVAPCCSVCVTSCASRCSPDRDPGS